MPVVRVRAGQKHPSGQLDALVRRATEKASDLLEQNDRVLVVYGEGRASIYYEGDAVPIAAGPLSRVS